MAATGATGVVAMVWLVTLVCWVVDFHPLIAWAVIHLAVWQISQTLKTPARMPRSAGWTSCLTGLYISSRTKATRPRNPRSAQLGAAISALMSVSALVKRAFQAASAAAKMFMDEVPLFVSGERKAKHKTRMATPVRSGVPTPESDVGPEVSEVFCGRVEGDAGTGAVLEGDGVAGDDA